METHRFKPFWPQSLAARTALWLLAGLALVQVSGLTIHAFDRVDLQRLAQARDIAIRGMSLYRSVALMLPEQREEAVRDVELEPGARAMLSASPPAETIGTATTDMQRQMRVDMQLVPIPALERPREMVILGGPQVDRVVLGMRLPEGRWLNITLPMPPPRPWHSSSFLIAFLSMTATAGVLILWAVRRLIHPVGTLAAAAEALGRDVNAAPMPTEGPTEIAQAAAAFNTMAERIRRFVQDRTFMLTAIGHDLRTPVTRLKLRAEFMEDDTQRRKMLADLDELESMVAATLAFGRDATADEAVSAIDLSELARTILDEAADAHPDAFDKLHFEGPDHLTVRARSVSLKRAITNLVINAVKYGDGARVSLSIPYAGPGGATVALMVDDDGPGIPADQLDQVFQPFHRVEGSRNRETGGVGLGLTIARNIMRAHGGDVDLQNRPEGGLRAVMTLPV